MELHERWLADLRSDRMKDKLALAEGKITSEEYMTDINKTEQQSNLTDKVWELADLTIQGIYRLRNFAAKSNNGALLAAIKVFLNARYGTEGSPATHFWLKTVTIEEVLAMLPPVVKVVIDHEIVDPNVSESRSHELSRFIHDKFDGKISVEFHSGPINGDRLENDHVVLLALNTGFAVLKARGTSTSGCIVVYPDLALESLANSGKPLSPDDDPSQFYTQGVKPMEPSSDKVWSPVDPNTLINRE